MAAGKVIGGLLLVTLLMATATAAAANGTFVFDKDPYVDGPLTVQTLYLTPSIGSPLHSAVYFPTEAGQYVVYFFIGGLGGIVPAETYSTTLKRIASHGVVVVGVDTTFPLLEWQAKEGAFATVRAQQGREKRKEPDVMFQLLDWLKGNLDAEIGKKAAGVTADLTKLTVGGHSAGCDIVTYMVMNNATFATSAILLEPAGIAQPITMAIPAMAYGTELASQAPSCTTPGNDYRSYYNTLKCPRFMIYVAGFGHCDILDPLFREGCHIINFCKTVSGVNLPLYRTFAQGIQSAFIIGTAQGNAKALQYVTDQTVIPLQLGDLASDDSCAAHHA